MIAATCCMTCVCLGPCKAEGRGGEGISQNFDQTPPNKSITLKTLIVESGRVIRLPDSKRV